MQSSARIPKLLNERVLCAHRKGVVCSLKGYCFHIFHISKPFCRYHSGIWWHAELQVTMIPLIQMYLFIWT